jgi:Colicin E5 ribonuclease domain
MPACVGGKGAQNAQNVVARARFERAIVIALVVLVTASTYPFVPRAAADAGIDPPAATGTPSPEAPPRSGRIEGDEPEAATPMPEEVSPKAATAGLTEAVERRTATTKTFLGKEPGTYVMQVSSRPVHFQHNGAWKDIDARLAAAGGDAVASAANGFQTRLGLAANAAKVAEVRLDETHSVGFGFSGASPTRGRPDEENASVIAAAVTRGAGRGTGRMGGGTRATSLLDDAAETVPAGRSTPRSVAGNYGGEFLDDALRSPVARPDLGNLSSIQRQMGTRGWTPDLIDEAVQQGRAFPAVNKLGGANTPATRYVHPRTGQSVVIDNATGQVIQVGGPGFRY